jgi:primosomal protein N' (replication factor Y)
VSIWGVVVAAGRGERAGEVFIQTYWASHAAIRAVECHDRELFVSAELGERREGNYPPFSRLANVICWGGDAAAVRRVLDGISSAVRSSVEGRAGWEVLGPTDCLKARVKDRTRRHLLVKAPVGEELGPLLDACVRAQDKPRGVNVAIDVDAYDMM